METSTSGSLWRAMIITAVGLTMSAPPAHAHGFLYRSGITGRWTKLASIGDPLPVDSAFAPATFAGFLGSKGIAPIASVAPGACGPDAVTLAAFTASVSRSSTNTGIFLFEAATAKIHDVAVEGATTPLGGSWDTFTASPVLAIDAEGCVAHVVFRGRASGTPPGMDTGVFDATFALPGLTSTGINVVAQEGVTAPGAPFPPTAVLSEVRPQVALAVSDSAGVGVLIGFPMRVTDSAVSSADDSGVLAIGPAGVSVLLREGDPSCVPPWPNGGTMYDDFADTRPLGMAALGAPSVLLEAASRDGTAKVAIVLNSGGCGGTTVVLAAPGGVGPDGSTFALTGGTLWPLDLNAGGDAAFLVTTKMPGEIVNRRTLIRSSTGVVAREQLANTSLGPAVKISGLSTSPSTNAASDLVFGAKALAQGLFFAASDGSAPELLSFGGANPQMDDLGNMTASF